MDKRTLVFFLVFSLSLFAVNAFFSYQDQQRSKEWVTQQDARKKLKLKQLQEEIVQKTSPMSAFDIMWVYPDEQSTQPSALAVKTSQNLLFFSWTTHLPETVFARNQGSTENLQKYQLLTSGQEGELAIYSQDGKTPLQTAPLPEIGSYDLQIVTLPHPDAAPLIAWGEFRDGSLSLPIARLAKEIPTEFASQVPHARGVVFLKSGGKYLPVGTFDPEHQILTEIQELNLPNLSSSIVSAEAKMAPAGQIQKEEKFYVLQNNYQQLVFSNVGGALVEINLPFQSPENQQSIVKEIGFDREIQANHPQNARFPGHAYYTPGSAKGAFEFHDEGQLGGFYPLLRRDLNEKPPFKSIRVKPQFYAQNIVSEYPEVSELVYEVKQFDQNTIVFEAVQQHRRITKTFSIANENQQAPYCFDLAINIEGDSRGLWLNSGIPDVEWISGSFSPTLKYRITRNTKAEIENLSLPKDTLTISSSSPDWVCNSNGFLGIIVNPLTPIDSGVKALRVPGTVVPSRLIQIDQEYQVFKAADLPGYNMLLPLKSSGGTMRFRVFAGPFAASVLKTVDQTFFNEETGYNPDYLSCQSFHGWFSFISEPFAKFLLILMKFFYSTTGSWALSIILLTVALRLLLYPLNAWSVKSMLHMQEIAPQVTELQERYKKDPKKLQLEIANLYREKGINPLSGCFPLLIQMPFLIGMFDLLKSTFELRGASFIPGWIDNLAAPDVLFSWHYPIFFIGTEFHLLPILLGVVMFLQQRLSSNLPKDVSLMTEQQRQQRVMGNLMTVVFTIMFYHVPSGLNIYWLSSMLLGMLQQWWTGKRLRSKAALEAVTKKAPERKKVKGEG